MNEPPIVTSEQYAASATSAAIAAFRQRCRDTARALVTRRVRPDDLLVIERTTLVPRWLLGLPMADAVRTRRIVGAHGWALHEVTTPVAGEGGHRSCRRTTCVLAPDGRLLKAELHLEERNGVPGVDDRTVLLSEAQDHDLAIWNRIPQEHPWVADAGYLHEFPGALRQGLDALLER